jgi:cytochrome c5
MPGEAHRPLVATCPGAAGLRIGQHDGPGSHARCGGQGIRTARQCGEQARQDGDVWGTLPPLSRPCTCCQAYEQEEAPEKEFMAPVRPRLAYGESSLELVEQLQGLNGMTLFPPSVFDVSTDACEFLGSSTHAPPT